MEFGDWLHDRRKAIGKSQRGILMTSELSISSIQWYEQNKGLPNISNLKEISRIYKIDEDEIKEMYIRSYVKKNPFKNDLCFLMFCIRVSKYYTIHDMIEKYKPKLALYESSGEISGYIIDRVHEVFGLTDSQILRFYESYSNAYENVSSALSMCLKFEREHSPVEV